MCNIPQIWVLTYTRPQSLSQGSWNRAICVRHMGNNFARWLQKIVATVMWCVGFSGMLCSFVTTLQDDSKDTSADAGDCRIYTVRAPLHYHVEFLASSMLADLKYERSPSCPRLFLVDIRNWNRCKGDDCEFHVNVHIKNCIWIPNRVCSWSIRRVPTTY